MNHLTIASTEADARAAEAVEEHHARLAGALAMKAEALVAVARGGRSNDLAATRDDLVRWARTELVPHARAEEDTLYRVAAERPEGRLLVEAMLAEHEVIVGLVDDLSRAVEAVSAASTAAALRVLFETHLAKENDQVLPLLVADPDVSVADLLGGMHELLGGPEAPADEAGCGAGGHACACGADDGSAYPELDARSIPHAIRHATVLGALDTVRVGQGLVLLAPHDPLPLLAQIDRREPGAFAVDYLQRGPETWRLRLVRTGS
ncbi:MAG TPA: DUF2249 domain-containing protein [Nocardioides sp.]|uniref:DUF2249 domain-containing protein n=1 Tax=Nocardioides sp. TaxID=35761 RepID=UPI002D80373A|nr:DUF2249 domain-containing protein [Nocardioides sp.]HET6652715.1 DUF2249 domain-containing protein [Nocardioides sp.]